VDIQVLKEITNQMLRSCKYNVNNTMISFSGNPTGAGNNHRMKWSKSL